MKNIACLLFALSAVGACVTGTDDAEDGRDDSFLAGDGKADTGSIVEGSPEALAVLQVANEHGAEEMHDHGVPKRAAQNIVAVRLGDDGIAGTSDDVTFATLAQLDAVPYVGPHAFARLLAYANELASPMPTNTPLTPPADLWHVASCTPISWSQLVALFPPGQTSYSFDRQYVTASRRRDACNSITGCTPWKDDTVALWVHHDDSIDETFGLNVPTGAGGALMMNLSTSSPEIGITGYPSSFYLDEWGYIFGCGSVTPTYAGNMQCAVSLERWYDGRYMGYASFSRPRNDSAQAKLEGRVCADGSFHFTTSVLDDDSNSLQNLAQIAIYGQLF
jgi:hypothetical protein